MTHMMRCWNQAPLFSIESFKTLTAVNVFRTFHPAAASQNLEYGGLLCSYLQQPLRKQPESSRCLKVALPLGFLPHT